MNAGIRIFAGLSASLLLTACTGSGIGDLEGFVAEVKARPPGRVEPVPEFRSYETYTYAVHEMRSPFKAGAVESEFAGSGSGSGIRPDQNRRREALEGFPLDTLKFVGHMARDGETWAIITAPDGLVYRVQSGNYLGQNHGMITAVSEAKLNLTEIIPDGLGGWIERDASLALAE